MSRGHLCGDDHDAMGLARSIDRKLGDLPVSVAIPKEVLLDVARRAEAIARWARKEANS